MICRKCNTEMKHRDYVKRLVRTENGQKNWIKIERVICPNCHTITRVLPDYILPFKHYTKDIVDGVLNGDISPEQIEYEDYPSEITMKRWKNRKK